MKKTKLAGAIALLGAIFAIGCSSGPSWKQPSGSAAGVPERALPFAQYAAQNHTNIARLMQEQRFAKAQQPPFIGQEYTSGERVAQLRAPFERSPQAGCDTQGVGSEKAFLLVHGLTDSPYLLKSVADTLQQAYPCSRSRAVLLPGHGTLVGDSRNMRYQDWLSITDYGLNSLQRRDDVKEIYLVGFSTGTALSIRQLVEKSSAKVEGVVMLSTAVEAASDMAWAAAYLRWFKSWLSDIDENDAARYSSFATNAGAEFYALTKNLTSAKYTLKVPVLMAVSSDDQTINAASARRFFCNNTPNKQGKLIWYQGEKNADQPSCEGIETVATKAQQYQLGDMRYTYASVSHTGVSMDPRDAHYGVTGAYRDCKSYAEADDSASLAGCLDRQNPVLFGEKNNKGLAEGLGLKYFSRATFNPYYPQLAENIVCFVDKACDVSKVSAGL